MRAIAARNSRVAVRGGRKTGKSEAIAAGALHHYATRPRAAVYVVSNSELQSERVVWKAIKRLHAQSKQGPYPLDGTVNLRSRFGVSSDDLATRSIQSLNAASAEAFAGLSGADQLSVIDEASAQPDEHFRAVEGNMLGGGTIACISNPTRSQGFFAEFWLSPKHTDSRWTKFTLSSLDVPPGIPGLANPDMIAAWAHELGEDSSDYKIHVLGEHVSADEGSSFSRDLVEAAMARPQVFKPADPLFIGVDPAGEGKFGKDLSAFAVRRGAAVLELVTHDRLSAQGHVAVVGDLLQRHRVNPDELAQLNVDRGGGVGNAVYRSFVEASEGQGTRVRGFEFSGKPVRHHVAVHNVAAELLWNLRLWLRAGGSLPQDDHLSAELRAWQFERINSNSEVVKVDKDQIRKLLGRSPDRCDAVALACWTPSNY